MQTENIIGHADDGSFETLIGKADRPMLVDFWAPWCGPCRAVAPVLEEVAREYAGKVDVVKVNVDDSPVTAAKYGIRSIPTLLVIREGRIVANRIGMAGKRELAELIEGGLES